MKKNIFLHRSVLFLIVLALLNISAQNSHAVSIHGFTPSSGWAASTSDPESGTLIRIRGRNFDADPINNEVYFSDGSGGGVLAPLRATFTEGSIYELQYTMGAPGSALGELDHPYDVAVYDARIIFVANQRNNRIEVFEFDGLPVRHIGAGDLDVIYGVAIGPADGNVYVSHVDPATSMGRISVYDQMGTHLHDLGAAFLEFPQDLVVDGHGAVYVIDGGIGLERFVKITADDHMVYQHTGPSDRPFRSLAGIALEDPDAPMDTFVYVTDRLTNNIYKYNSSGLYLWRWDIVVDLGYSAGILAPGHIGIDPDRDVYVDIGDTVLKLDSDGNVLGEVLDTSLLPPADFRMVDRNKKIYAVESSPPTIQAVKVFNPTDAEELLVHVPAGVQTGRITVVRHTPTIDETHTSSDEFHVIEAGGTLTVGDFEITQGLPTYPLVEGKPTLLYGDIEGFFGHPGRDTATLRIMDSDDNSEDLSIDYFSYGDDWTSPRTQIRFHIPPRMMEPDTYTFSVLLERDGASIYPGDPWTSDPKTVDGTKAMALAVVKYSDVPNSDWNTVDPFPWFDMDEFLYGIETFKRTYPFSPREISVHFIAGKYMDSIRDGVHRSDEDRLIAETQRAMNSFSACTPANLCVQRGVGLVDPGLMFDTGNRGWANYNSNAAVTYLFEPTYRGETVWGGFLCHEVGHTLGLVPDSNTNRNPLSIDHHSLNMFLEDEDEQPFDAWNSHLNEFASLENMRSIMYTGSGLDDVSFFESRYLGEEVDYPYLLGRVRNESGSSSLLPSPLPAAPTPKMVIMGILKEGNILTMDESYVTEEELPLTPVRVSDYSVVFLDAADSILVQDTFEVNFSLDDTSGDPTEILNLIRPFPAGTAKVEVRFETDVLGSLVRSANPPSIGGLNVNLAMSLPVISWQANDPDGGALSYTVLYSANGGATYKPIVANIRESFYRWEHSLTPGSDNAVVKVIANDGFHQAITKTPVFSLPGKGPQIAITVPSEGQVFKEGDLIRLKGIAFDPEEGLLTGTSLQWKMGDHYFLGTGDTLALSSHPETIPAGDMIQVPFEVGTHLFKLTARDNEGNEVSEHVSIEVITDTDRDGFSDDDEEGAGTDPYDPFNRPYRPPVAVQKGQYKAIEGEHIVYDARDSYDPDGEELFFDWNFSDGGSGTGTVKEHSFGDEGKYEVVLTATDPGGLSDTEAKEVYVYNAHPEIEITSIKQPNPFFVLPFVHKLSFIGSFSDAGWLDTHVSKWIFGDGTSASGTVSEEHIEPDATGTTKAKHAYSTSGTYTVKVELKDDDGAVDTDTKKVIVVDQISALKYMGTYIQKIPDEYFEKPAKEKKAYFEKMINEVMKRLYQKDYYGAIKILKNDIRIRCDGYAGGNPKDDWIIKETAQKEVCLMIDDLAAYLEYFLKGIKK